MDDICAGRRGQDERSGSVKVKTSRMREQDATAGLLREFMSDDKKRGTNLLLRQAHDADAFMHVSFVNPPDNFRLCYQEGKGGKAYRCDRLVSRREAEDALLEYLEGNSSWRDRYQWKAISKLSVCAEIARSLLVIGVAVGGAVYAAYRLIVTLIDCH